MINSICKCGFHKNIFAIIAGIVIGLYAEWSKDRETLTHGSHEPLLRAATITPTQLSPRGVLIFAKEEAAIASKAGVERDREEITSSSDTIFGEQAVSGESADSKHVCFFLFFFFSSGSMFGILILSIILCIFFFVHKSSSNSTNTNTAKETVVLFSNLIYNSDFESKPSKKRL